jgi:small conductance mechanosensitive channel
MRRTLSLILWLVCATGVWTLSAASARAQEAPPPVQASEPAAEDETARTLAAEGQALVARLQALRTRIEELRDEIPGLEGKERYFAMQKAADAKADYAEVLELLVTNQLDREERGQDASAQRAWIEADLDRLDPLIARMHEMAWEEGGNLRVQIDQLEFHERAEPEQFLERLVGWSVDVLQAELLLLELRTQMGEDTTAPRAVALTHALSLAKLADERLALISELDPAIRKQLEIDPDDPDAKAAVLLAESRRAVFGEALGKISDAIDTLGGDSTEYRERIIESTGTLTTDIFREGVARGLLATWWDGIWDWFTTNAPVLLFRLFAFVMILLAARVVGGITRWFLLWRLDRRPGQHSLLRQMIESLAVRTALFIGLLVGLSQLGLQLGPILAGLGIVGFIVGFALQDTLSNFAAGVMVLLYRPFDVGDMIEAAGVKGTVHRMNLVSTTILTIDNQTLIVPNGRIWGNVIRNVTSQDVRRVDLKFRIAYTEDLGRIEEIFRDILMSHPKTLEEPAPRVSLHEMGEYAMEIIVRPWVKTSDYWPVYWELLRTIKLRLDAEGIAIPLPGRELHVVRDEPRSDPA